MTSRFRDNYNLCAAPPNLNCDCLLKRQIISVPVTRYHWFQPLGIITWMPSHINSWRPTMVSAGIRAENTVPNTIWYSCSWISLFNFFGTNTSGHCHFFTVHVSHVRATSILCCECNRCARTDPLAVCLFKLICDRFWFLFHCLSIVDIAAEIRQKPSHPRRHPSDGVGRFFRCYPSSDFLRVAVALRSPQQKTNIRRLDRINKIPPITNNELKFGSSEIINQISFKTLWSQFVMVFWFGNHEKLQLPNDIQSLWSKFVIFTTIIAIIGQILN